MLSSLRRLALCLSFVGMALAQRPMLRQSAVAQLPAASINNGVTVFVTDGSSATDCTVGGGVYAVACRSNGNTWSAQTVGTAAASVGVPYSQSFTSQTSVTLAHNLNTLNVIVSCYDSSNRMIVPGSETITNANNVAIGFSAAETGRCVVNGGVGPQGAAGAGTSSSVQIIPSSASPGINLSSGNYIAITLTANTTPSFSAPVVGTTYHFQICQDSSGNHTWTWPTSVSGGITIGSGANTCSMQDVSAWSNTALYGLSSGLINEPGSVSSSTGGTTTPGTVQTITYSSTPAINLAAGSYLTITLTGNAAPTFSGIAAGQTYRFQICQDGSGNHTWTWPNLVSGGIVVGSNASTCSVQELSAWSNSGLYGVDTGIINR